MRILVIGNGGREHALVWKLRQSPRVSEVLCIPGNGGICEEATCLPGDPKNIEAILSLAHQQQPDITVVGPEVRGSDRVPVNLPGLGLPLRVLLSARAYDSDYGCGLESRWHRQRVARRRWTRRR